MSEIEIIEKVCLADVQAEQVQWLWPHRIPFGKVTIIEGDPGVGKSALLLDIAARVTTGTPMPDGTAEAHLTQAEVAARSSKLGSVPGSVALLTAEDGLSDTVRPRLEAAGARLDRIVAVKGVFDYEDNASSCVRLPDHIEVLSQFLRSREITLLILDPLVAYLGAQINAWRDQDVRGALAPLAVMAEETGVAAVVSRHLTKGERGSAIYRGGGSIGIIGAARCAFLVAKDPEENERRVVAPIKMNVSRMPPALTFYLEEHASTLRLRWSGESPLTADALLARPDLAPQGPLEEAKKLLEELLLSGPVPKRDIVGTARGCGISSRTLERAKQALGIAHRRDGFGRGSEMLWSLPGHSRQTGRSGELGENGRLDVSEPVGKNRTSHTRHGESLPCSEAALAYGSGDDFGRGPHGSVTPALLRG